MQAPRESDVQAIGQEGDEDVRLDASLELVKDRPDREIAFEVFERLLDVGAQQIAAFARERACRSLLRSSRKLKVALSAATSTRS